MKYHTVIVTIINFCSLLQELNGRDLGGSQLEISLAKPPSDKKKKEEMLRKREARMMKTMNHQ